MAETSFPSQVSLVFLMLCMSSLQKERRKKFWTWLFSRVGRSSTTPSRNFTTSPKLSSYSSASISSTVANGDSGCTPGYTLNNSTSSGNRHGVFFVCLFVCAKLRLIQMWKVTTVLTVTRPPLQTGELQLLQLILQLQGVTVSAWSVWPQQFGQHLLYELCPAGKMN